jgi:hypothetical protein
MTQNEKNTHLLVALLERAMDLLDDARAPRDIDGDDPDEWQRLLDALRKEVDLEAKLRLGKIS